MEKVAFSYLCTVRVPERHAKFYFRFYIPDDGHRLVAKRR